MPDFQELVPFVIGCAIVAATLIFGLGWLLGRLL